MFWWFLVVGALRDSYSDMRPSASTFNNSWWFFAVNAVTQQQWQHYPVFQAHAVSLRQHGRPAAASRLRLHFYCLSAVNLFFFLLRVKSEWVELRGDMWKGEIWTWETNTNRNETSYWNMGIWSKSGHGFVSMTQRVCVGRTDKEINLHWHSTMHKLIKNLIFKSIHWHSPK